MLDTFCPIELQLLLIIAELLESSSRSGWGWRSAAGGLVWEGGTSGAGRLVLSGGGRIVPVPRGRRAQALIG